MALSGSKMLREAKNVVHSTNIWLIGVEKVQFSFVWLDDHALLRWNKIYIISLSLSLSLSIPHILYIFHLHAYFSHFFKKNST